MQEKQKLSGKTAHSRSDKRTVTLVMAAGIIIAIIAAFFIFQQPERSVASYCKVYKEEKARLANTSGDTYKVAVFPDVASSDAGDFAKAFGNLEKVAPDEIKADVGSLKQVFEKIKSDPSQGFGASLSGLGAESSVKDWTTEHCN